MRRSREEEADIRHRYAASPDQDLRFLLRLTSTDTTSKLDDEHDEPTEELRQASEAMAWDDVSGAILDASKVQKARAEEIAYVEKKQVWRKISRREAKQR